MSSTILHKTEFLTALGERVRALRARRGLTRKSLAAAADVSERHLANLEYGTGNASILILQQVANSLQCSLAELLGDVTTSNPEWLMIREQLAHADEAMIRRVRLSIDELLGASGGQTRNQRVALIGLRGAGKSTLGQRLADDLGFPFVEVNREIETLAGCSVNELQALYGMNAYRRYEKRALEAVIQSSPQAIIATPGGMVSDVATFNLLLSACTTVWLKAEPEDHMQRVIAQGDMRPMASSKEAMEDLKQILKGRAAFYSKADVTINTSAQDEAATFELLSAQVKSRLLITS
jgi:XRE family transcriptional regulator, aerobic/anaerobic benzoate catabolism transcriptional regulator